MNRRHFSFACLGMLAGGGGAAGKPPSSGRARFNVRFPTLGGKQFWSDVWLKDDWRIQRHAVTGHHRLLDGRDVRQAWGTRQACQETLRRLAAAHGLKDGRGVAVVVLHGLGRTRSAMKKVSAVLKKRGPYHVFNVGYATTRAGVADHARAFASVMQSLAHFDKVHFLAHSLGNLVIRRWLHDVEKKTVEFDRRRLGRMVMLAPPNQRPVIASQVIRLAGARQIGGQALLDLSEDWAELAPTLADPPIEFGIVAGGKGDERGYNPWVPGDDDMIVSVEGTKLAGARDFRVVRSVHTFIMDQPSVHDFALRFFRDGCFETDAKRVAVPHS